MKTKRLLPYCLLLLLLSVVLLGARTKDKPNETPSKAKVFQKANYMFSLQLFQTI